MRLSDLEKRAEETQDIELHQAVPRARGCDDYTMQPAAVADDDDHNSCINVKFPLTQVVSQSAVHDDDVRFRLQVHPQR